MRFLLIIILILHSTFNLAFSREEGVEIMFSVPFGGSYSYHNVNFVNNPDIDFFFTYNKNRVHKSGFETGFEFLVGYFLPLSSFDMSIFANIAYSYDYFGLKVLDVNESYSFNNLKLGLDLKFFVDNLSIGLAAGLKVPLGLIFTTYSSYMIGDFYYSASDLNEKLKLRIMPYLQLSLDYIFKFDYFNILIGPYVGYDFGLLVNSDDIYIDTKDLSSVDFGIKISMLLSINNFINKKENDNELIF